MTLVYEHQNTAYVHFHEVIVRCLLYISPSKGTFNNEFVSFNLISKTVCRVTTLRKYSIYHLGTKVREAYTLCEHINKLSM